MPKYRWKVKWLDGTEKQIDSADTEWRLDLTLGILVVHDLLGNAHCIPWAGVREVEREQIQEAPGAP